MYCAVNAQVVYTRNLYLRPKFRNKIYININIKFSRDKQILNYSNNNNEIINNKIQQIYKFLLLEMLVKRCEMYLVLEIMIIILS